MAWRILRLFVQRKRDVIPLCFGQRAAVRPPRAGANFVSHLPAFLRLFVFYWCGSDGILSGRPINLEMGSCVKKRMEFNPVSFWVYKSNGLLERHTA
jgi:hypothetical protein